MESSKPSLTPNKYKEVHFITMFPRLEHHSALAADGVKQAKPDSQ
jgi:hypothetical protein